MRHKLVTTYLPILALLALLGVTLWANGAWLGAHEHAYGGQDETHHYVRGLLVHDQLTMHGRRLFAGDSIDWLAWWPPLTYFATAVPLALLGRSQAAMAWTGTLFLAALLIFTYRIGARRSRWTGFLAAALTAVLPPIVAYSRQYNLDIGLAACVAGAVWLLLASDGFSRWWASVGCGLLCGVGLLAKVVFPAFVLPPLAIELWRRRADLRRANYLRLGVAAAVALGVAAFWYLPRLRLVAAALTLHVVGYQRDFGIGQAESGRFFLFDAYDALGLIGALVVLGGLAVGVARRNRHTAPLLGWLVVPVALFAVAPSDLARFALAAWPAAAVLVAVGLTTLAARRPWTTTAVAAVLAVAAAWTWAGDRPPVARLVAPDELTRPILAHLDRRDGRVCYIQNTRDSVLSGEHFRFLTLLETPRLRWTQFGPFQFHLQQFERLSDCLGGDAVLVFRTDGAAAWPTRQALREVVLGANEHSLRRVEGLAKGHYPPDFDFAAWPDQPPADRRLVATAPVRTTPPGEAADRLLIYARVD